VGESVDRTKRRCAAAVVVLGAHIALFLLIRYQLLHPHAAVQPPEFVSIWLTPETLARSRAPSASREATGASRTSPAPIKGKRMSRTRPIQPESSVESSTGLQPKQSPHLKAPPAIDWLAEATTAARDEIASENETKHRAEWLSRGTDPETHPLMQAFRPLYPKAPEFGWYNARIHRVQEIKGEGLLIWINDRCFLLFAGLAFIPVCKIGHMEANGALYAHMRDPDPPVVPNPLP
jgi:hypothetical protein